jgi:hypothetical protein
MIRVDVMDDRFNRAYWQAKKELPVEPLELPRQYGIRWREAYRCRVDANSPAETVYYIFDRDEDYTWFMLKYS